MKIRNIPFASSLLAFALGLCSASVMMAKNTSGAMEVSASRKTVFTGLYKKANNN